MARRSISFVLALAAVVGAIFAAHSAFVGVTSSRNAQQSRVVMFNNNKNDPRVQAAPPQADIPIELVLTSYSVGIRQRVSFLPGTKMGEVKKVALEELGFGTDWAPESHWKLSTESGKTPQEMIANAFTDDQTLFDIGANIGTEVLVWYCPP
eukprot:TRINITY_DN141_c1_g1_i4.p1 TRINITY_DN141_c1_g1~~TRINITY_DN141_c1_g1_i4.p1  ORF type:complete len:174 (+),score=33.48 TRINITY_DN141_c1_g1_i4:69-524(+)